MAKKGPAGLMSSWEPCDRDECWECWVTQQLYEIWVGFADHGRILQHVGEVLPHAGKALHTSGDLLVEAAEGWGISPVPVYGHDPAACTGLPKKVADQRG